MTDKVLTDDEKNALLDGVQSGDVEVQSSAGPTYASVTPFEIGPRSRIFRDSYPRLQSLNQQFADRLSKQTEQMLQYEIRISPRDTFIRSYGECCERLSSSSAVTIFDAPPLAGHALIAMEPALVRHLVDTFFGGTGEEGNTNGGTAFTPGELSVSRLFANVILTSIKEVWASLSAIVPERIESESTLGLIDFVGESDRVLATEFEVSTAEKDGTFHVLWPVEMIQPLMPAFEGKKVDRNRNEEMKWQAAISRTLADSTVRISANVGHARMKLGSLIELAPGDVIEIEDPRRATLMAKDVPLIGGRFGVHLGHNAVEATDWFAEQFSDLETTGKENGR